MIKAEAKVQARLEAERVEKEKAAALEAERKAAKEAAAAAEKKASESLMNAPSEANKVPKEVTSHKHSTGNTTRASENAQKLEEKRLIIYNEIASQSEALGSGSNKRLGNGGS